MICSECGETIDLGDRYYEVGCDTYCEVCVEYNNVSVKWVLDMLGYKPMRLGVDDYYE